MYILKNAVKNTTRNKSKNILICIIITVITICSCITLSIYKAGTNLVTTYKKTNSLEVSLNLDMQKLRSASNEEKSSFSSISVDDIKNYANSSLIKDYYYTLEASLSSNSINPVEDNKKPSNNEEDKPSDQNEEKKKFNMGDFRITAYSNFAYLSDFTDGNKKITSGKMVTGSSNENEIVISSSLASTNNLKVGDEVTFTLSDNEEETFTYKVIGIYSSTNEQSDNNFMQMNALNEANQIYANLSSIENILKKQDNDNDKLIDSNGLQAKFYLNKNSDLKKFEKEVKNKGLSKYYNVDTNENEITETLKPINNIKTFSLNFLIVVLTLGTIILTIINVLNIRDRKYEIGVLRAIGMSKLKVTLQLMCETFIIALFSLIVGTTIGIILSQPVTDKILSSEISSYQEKTDNLEKNFGGSNMERPSEQIQKDDFKGKENKNMKQDKTTTYVDSLKVKIDFLTILELFGVSILLTLVSTATVSIIINKYNPNKILQNRL